MALGALSISKLKSRKTREPSSPKSDIVNAKVRSCCETPDITPETESRTKPSGKVPADSSHV
jgi:hypothetical protein